MSRLAWELYWWFDFFNIKIFRDEPVPVPAISFEKTKITTLGHPIACTGTRVLVTLLDEMQRSGAQYGLECICGGGGLGIAAIVERV
ncbi:MAG: hypothetical protein HKO91_08100 [Desulfobacterales bacterium]|nr:hypothetical protein [Desulfobacterales bacterium]